MAQNNTPTAKPTYEQLLAENARLRQIAEAKGTRVLSVKVTDKGGISLYGLGRFPVTLYKDQWLTLFGDKAKGLVMEAIEQNGEVMDLIAAEHRAAKAAERAAAPAPAPTTPTGKLTFADYAAYKASLKK
jgi:hypothetical protein